MTPRPRLLFNLLLCLPLAGGMMAAEPAPDLPGVESPSAPPVPANPKRRFTDRVNFHETQPLDPAKPAPRPEENLLPEAARPAFNADEFKAERPAMRMKPRLPTKAEVEQARERMNWLNADRFQTEADRADRRLADAALGIQEEEEEPDDTDDPENGKESGEEGGDSEKSGRPPDFGDFFERMKDNADALADVNFDDEAGNRRADQQEREQEAEREAQEAAATRRETIEAGNAQPAGAAGFNPAVTTGPAAAGQAATRPAMEERAGLFRPVLGSPGLDSPGTARGGVPERDTFQGSNALLSSIGSRRGVPSGGTDPGFAGLDRGAIDRPLTPADATGFRPLDTPDFGGDRPGFGLPAAPASSGFSPLPTEIPPPSPRFAIQPDAAPRLGSEFGGLRPAQPVLDSPAARVDRWERDRMQSQLIGEPGPRANPRRAAP